MAGWPTDEVKRRMRIAGPFLDKASLLCDYDSDVMCPAGGVGNCDCRAVKLAYEVGYCAKSGMSVGCGAGVFGPAAEIASAIKAIVAGIYETLRQIASLCGR